MPIIPTLATPAEMGISVPENEKPLPKTINELVAKNTLFQPEGLTHNICLICDEKYVSGPTPEFALKLPGCSHVFGLNCIQVWLGEEKNTCPLCREPILDLPPPEDEQEENQEDDEWLIDGRVALSLVVVEWHLDEIHDEVQEAAGALFNMTDRYMFLELELLSLGAGIPHHFDNITCIMFGQLYGVPVRRNQDQLIMGPGPTPTFNAAGGQLFQQFTIIEHLTWEDGEENPDIADVFEALAILHTMMNRFLDERERLLAAFAAQPSPEEANRYIYELIMTLRGFERSFQASVARTREPRDPDQPNEIIMNFYNQIWLNLTAKGMRNEIVVQNPFASLDRGELLFPPVQADDEQN